jgi:transposase-like protein
VKEQIVDMAMNASGVRDTARVLHVSTARSLNSAGYFFIAGWLIEHTSFAA